MSTSVVFSGAGTLAADYPKDVNLQTKMRSVTELTPANSETVTITHGSDAELARTIRIIKADGTEEFYPGQTANVLTSVTRTSATVTTIVFGSAAAAAGPYKILIEF